MSDVIAAPIDDDRAWRGGELSDTAWVTQLSAEQIELLNQATEALPADSGSWLSHERTKEHKPALTSVLAKASEDLATGRGFVLLRGLDAQDPERLRRAFWFIARELGEPVMQNARGEVLSIVADRFAGAERGVDTRGYESNDELRFHCDGGDCIGMACVRQAVEGGTNGLVSLFAIYNEILEHHPEHLEVLQQGYPLYARKEAGDKESTRNLGKVNPKRIPVFAWHQAQMSAWLNIQLAELAAATTGQEYTKAERDALACVEKIAGSPEVQLRFKQQPGDVLFINNLAVMHQRDKYIDPDEIDQRRMLYRMWINLHQSRPVIAEHAALRRGIRGPAPIIAA